MKTEHKGYRISGMVGDMSAEIIDRGKYPEVVIAGFGKEIISFDLEGLATLIEELEHVHSLTQQVSRCNELSRGVAG